MVDIVLLVILYAFLGGAIKYVDEAYDEFTFSKRSANAVAIAAGIIMGALMALDSPFSTAFFAAMLISLLIAKKIDNQAFVVGTVVAILSLATLAPFYQVSWNLIPIALFLFAGFLDEVGDGFAHRRELPDVLSSILHYRPFSDVALLVVIIGSGFTLLYIFPYFSFTFAYITVKRYAAEGSRVHAGVSYGIEKMNSLVDRLRSIRQ